MYKMKVFLQKKRNLGKFIVVNSSGQIEICTPAFSFKELSVAVPQCEMSCTSVKTLQKASD